VVGRRCLSTRSQSEVASAPVTAIIRTVRSPGPKPSPSGPPAVSPQSHIAAEKSVSRCLRFTAVAVPHAGSRNRVEARQRLKSSPRACGPRAHHGASRPEHSPRPRRGPCRTRTRPIVGSAAAMTAWSVWPEGSWWSGLQSARAGRPCGMVQATGSPGGLPTGEAAVDVSTGLPLAPRRSRRDISCCRILDSD
jgi:hypothetical protein